MNVRITIACDNATFEGAGGPIEVARILRKLARRLEQDCEALEKAEYLRLMDVNGNTVGQYETSEARSFEDWWKAEIVPTEVGDTREVAKPIAQKAWDAAG